MKKRSTEILQEMVNKEHNTFTLSGLASSFHVTQKTVRNDIAEINDYLEEMGMSPITFSHDGKLVTGDNFDAGLISRKLEEMDIYEYHLSPEERKVYILSVLLHDTGYIVMRKLADEMYVTRITVLGDVEKIRNELDSQGITLVSDSGKGVYLDCTDRQRVRLLLQIFKSISVSTENMGFFQRLILTKLDLAYSFSRIFSLLRDYMYNEHLIIMDDVRYDISLYLYAMFNVAAMTGAHEISDDESDMDSMDRLLVYIGGELDCPVSEGMLRDFRDYRTEKNMSAGIRKVDDLELYEVVTRFLSAIDADLDMELASDSLLIESLALHIKNLRGWDQDIELPKSENYDIDYALLMEEVSEHADIPEKYLRYPLGDNMKKSIVIHICVSIIRRSEDKASLSVMIVCPGSMATGKYLEVQVRDVFDFHIVGVAAAGDLSRRLAQSEHVDFILSTVRIETDVCPVLQVHPVLQVEDMNLIQRTAFSLGKHQPNVVSPFKAGFRAIQKIRTLVEDGRFTDGMYFQLQEILAQYKQEKLPEKTAIGALLSEENIIIDRQDLYPEWRSGIGAAGQILVENGCVTKGYVKQAQKNIEQYGDYIIIGKGTALAHARREYGALKEGLSLLVSKDGVLFSDGETRVHFLFFYATDKEETNADLFREIVSIGRDRKRSGALLDMDREEVWRELCEK